MDFNQLILRKQRRWARAAWILALALVLLAAIYLVLGGLYISPFEPLTPLKSRLLFDLRIPRLLAALVIGASLGVAGATLQVLLGNVLAEPGVVGISGGASVAMVLVLFFFLLQLRLKCLCYRQWLVL